MYRATIPALHQPDIYYILWYYEEPDLLTVMEDIFSMIRHPFFPDSIRTVIERV